MRYILDGTNIRLDETKDLIHDLEDKVVEMPNQKKQ